MPKVVAFPLLLTTIVYEPVPPTGKGAACDFTIASCGCAIVVGSFAVGVLAAPPPLACAELVSVPGGVVDGTLTVSDIAGKAEAGAIAALLEHVTICPAAEQLQPEPDAEA